jgi:acyl carrier protein
MGLRDRVVAVLMETVLRGKKLDVGDEDSLLDAGLIDSLGMTEMVDVLARHFSVTVPDDDLMPENLDSIAAITSYLQRKGVRE